VQHKNDAAKVHVHAENVSVRVPMNNALPLSTSQRHTGEVEVQHYSFLTLLLGTTHWIKKAAWALELIWGIWRSDKSLALATFEYRVIQPSTSHYRILTTNLALRKK
jgi:hypothetical protein